MTDTDRMESLAGTLLAIIPALERASGIMATEIPPAPGGGLSDSEWRALWLARAILEEEP